MALLGIILLVILIFGVLIFVHEFGHFLAAKRAGVEVEEFGFGFPPTIVGKQVGGTFYSLNWIPLGGFVRMKGEALTDVSAGAFGAASFWQKTRILFAGVIMNVLLAYAVLLWLCLTGLPPVIAGQFSSGTASYAQPKQVMVVDTVSGSPATTAGIVRGDIILSGDGQSFSSENDILRFTKAHAGASVTLQVEHHGVTRTVRPHLRPPGAKDGFLGVTPFQTYKLRYNLPDAVVTAAGITGQLIWATLSAFGGLVAGLVAHGQVSDNVAGPVGIVVLLKAVSDLGVAYVLIFVASISISLAVLNALPLPALDGGRWALAAAQRLTHKSLSQRLEMAVHATGFAALILLMVVITFFDIKHLHQ
ncbi:MAG TPA: site-2 protease family protein [Candidatus Saccharimonadales bacterium]|nr:site-2 protease family protein [Candidatus Saccharimonadales bacterium]